MTPYAIPTPALAEGVIAPTIAHIVRDRALAMGLAAEIIEKRRKLVQISDGTKTTYFVESENELNSTLARRLTKHKDMAALLLGRAGLPVPESAACETPEEAMAAVARLGFPLVVKPTAGMSGDGVTVGVESETEADAAVARAFAHARTILVERFVRGNDHRVLVLDGTVIGVIERRAPSVTGDGAATIEQLIERAQAERAERMGKRAKGRTLLQDEVFHAALARAGVTPRSVPAAGETVRLRGNANLSTGGVARDLPEIHPEIAALAAKAAAVFGLRLAGVDFLATDLLRRPEEAVILETNSVPGLTIHLSPDEGAARDVITPVIRAIFRGRA